MTSSSGFLTGSFRRTIWSMRVKMAVFAPIPSANERIATVEKTGLRRSPRNANRRSEMKDVMRVLDGARRVGVYLSRYPLSVIGYPSSVYVDVDVDVDVD